MKYTPIKEFNPPVITEDLKSKFADMNSEAVENFKLFGMDILSGKNKKNKDRTEPHYIEKNEYVPEKIDVIGKTEKKIQEDVRKINTKDLEKVKKIRGNGFLNLLKGIGDALMGGGESTTLSTAQNPITLDDLPIYATPKKADNQKTLFYILIAVVIIIITILILKKKK